MAQSQPAQRVEHSTIVVPAGTAVASPQSTLITFRDGDIVRIELDIPEGHRGVTGIRFKKSQAQVIPFTFGEWIVGNFDSKAWDLESYPESGRWTVETYNTGLFDHTFYVTWLYRELTLFIPAPIGYPLPVPIA